MLTSGRILAHLSNFITNINSTRECCSSFQIWSPVFFFFFIWNNSSILSCPSLKRVIHQPFFFSLWNLEQAFLLFALGNAVKMKSVFSNFLSSQFLSLYLPEFSYPPNPKNVWSHSENSNENETLSSGTSPLGYYCEVPPPPGVNTMVEWRGAGSGLWELLLFSFPRSPQLRNLSIMWELKVPLSPPIPRLNDLNQWNNPSSKFNSRV